MLASLRLAPSVVTLTVGGNDLLSAYGDLPADAAIVVGNVYDPSDGTSHAPALAR